LNGHGKNNNYLKYRAYGAQERLIYFRGPGTAFLAFPPTSTTGSRTEITRSN